MGRIALSALCLVLSFGNVARGATTITVGQGVGYDFTSVQAAIDAATTGDTVIVYPGIYYEYNIYFGGKNITVRSTDPTSSAIVAATILDANFRGIVVHFEGSETSSCVLSGFTIQNGQALTGGIYGGGSHATIRYNIIENNFGYNFATIYSCHGLIEGNIIRGNESIISAGLLACYGTIQGNTIVRNRGNGLAICLGTIRNNFIAHNLGTGLMYCGAVENNTIVGNEVGVGLSTGTIANCIIWGNVSRIGVQLYKSTTPTYSCIQDWTGGGEGNIASYPWFADANYYLLPKSPCVDAGNPAAEYNDACRPPGLGTSRNDMGAYGGPYNCLWPAPPPSSRAPRWRLYR